MHVLSPTGQRLVDKVDCYQVVSQDVLPAAPTTSYSLGIQTLLIGYERKLRRLHVCYEQALKGVTCIATVRKKLSLVVVGTASLSRSVDVLV